MASVTTVNLSVTYITSTGPIFTPDPGCASSWTWVPNLWLDAPTELLIQNAKLETDFFESCLPPGLTSMGVTPSSIAQVYSTSVCPNGYSAVSSRSCISDVVFTICCTSNYSYVSSSVVSDFGNLQTAYYEGCISDWSGTSTVSVFAGFFFSNYNLQGPGINWAQPLTIQWQSESSGSVRLLERDETSGPPESTPSSSTSTITRTLTRYVTATAIVDGTTQTGTAGVASPSAADPDATSSVLNTIVSGSAESSSFPVILTVDPGIVLSTCQVYRVMDSGASVNDSNSGFQPSRGQFIGSIVGSVLGGITIALVLVYVLRVFRSHRNRASIDVAAGGVNSHNSDSRSHKNAGNHDTEAVPRSWATGVNERGPDAANIWSTHESRYFRYETGADVGSSGLGVNQEHGIQEMSAVSSYSRAQTIRPGIHELDGFRAYSRHR